jgi:hypothetical protein
MTPQMQRTFFRTREAATKTLEELNDKAVRKNLIQQMSTVTSGLPGSVGERRKMRHELESMVQQIEAETADNDENGGAGSSQLFFGPSPAQSINGSSCMKQS